MNRWKGLMKKEWAQMKWKLVFFALINSAILFLGVDHLVYGVPDDFLTSLQPMIGICFMIHIIMAISLLFTSLGNDIGSVNIWLHSPAPVRQLVSVKFFIVFMATAFSLVLCGTIAAVSYVLGNGAPITNDVFLFLTVGIVILLNAIHVMAIVFFFWSIYQVFRSRISWVSIPIIIVLVNVWLFVWGIVWFTDVFQAVKEMWPMYGPIQTIDLLMVPNYIVPGGTILTIGSLVLYGLLTVLYYVSGSTLFEKKVRL